MVLLLVRTEINSYNATEHLRGCGMPGVKRGSMAFKFDAEAGCLGEFERECMNPVLLVEMNGCPMVLTR